MASLIPNLTQTSNASSPRLSRISTDHKLSDMKFPDDLAAYIHIVRKKAIHVANKREYVASLIPNLTQTSNASSPRLSRISTDHKLSDMKFPDDLAAYIHIVRN